MGMGLKALGQQQRAALVGMGLKALGQPQRAALVGVTALRQYISGIRLLNLDTAFTEQVNAEERKCNQ